MTDTIYLELNGTRPLAAYGVAHYVVSNLGRELRRVRLARGLTIRAAAEDLNLSPSTILRVEKGHNLRGQEVLRVLSWLERNDS